MTEAYLPEQLGRRAALNSYEELLDMMHQIKAQQDVPRRSLLEMIFESSDHEGQKPPTSYDQNRAFNIAASLLLMMDFGILHDAANISLRNETSASWREDLSLKAFLTEVFQPRPLPPDVRTKLSDLKARKLTKHAKLQWKATNGIRCHLLLDKKEKTVWLFHQGTALRQLLKTSDESASSSIIPRSIILEVLDTIHCVLFPSDLGSQEMLAYLVMKEDWDEGLLSDISTPYRRDSDAEMSYAYFGDRLEELYKELMHPTPHGWLQRRLQRKNETYMLMATMYGVIIAVMLGFLSLIAAIFQSWVAWQQWKHPVH